MITTNGIVGLSLLIGALRGACGDVQRRGHRDRAGHRRHAGDALPRAPVVHHQRARRPSSPRAQLAFAAVASLALYGLFVFVQTVRHRDYFLPETARRPERPRRSADATARPLISLGLLLARAGRGRRAGEAGVAGDRGRGRRRSGAPQSAVGVVIALLVLLPETLAAVRNARRDRMQTSFNLALGSAMASIGLTIPAIAIASIWLDGPLVLGLGATQIVLLAITAVVGALTVLPGPRDAAGGRRAPRAVRRRSCSWRSSPDRAGWPDVRRGACALVGSRVRMSRWLPVLLVLLAAGSLTLAETARAAGVAAPRLVRHVATGETGWFSLPLLRRPRRRPEARDRRPRLLDLRVRRGRADAGQGDGEQGTGLRAEHRRRPRRGRRPRSWWAATTAPSPPTTGRGGALQVKAGWPRVDVQRRECPETRGLAAADLDGDGSTRSSSTTTNTAETGAQVFVFDAAESGGSRAGAWPRLRRGNDATSTAPATTATAVTARTSASASSTTTRARGRRHLRQPPRSTCSTTTAPRCSPRAGSPTATRVRRHSAWAGASSSGS